MDDEESLIHLVAQDVTLPIRVLYIGNSSVAAHIQLVFLRVWL